jgi:ABC-type transport system involved in cytochrome c biogenesis permease subunit
MKYSGIRTAALSLLSLLSLTLAAPSASAQGGTRLEPWSEEVVELFESLPVQDGGRVKPFHTYAGFTLLRLQGKRSIKTPAGERLTPVEWLLDVFFYPEAASEYPTFLVQNDEVIGAIGVSLSGKKKRDRYSFNELRPGVSRLFTLAREYGQIEAKERSPVQQQVFVLASNVNSFMLLLTHLDFARASIELDPNPELERIFGGRTEVSFTDVLSKMGELRDVYRALAAEEHADQAEFREIAQVLQTASDLTDGTDFLALIPPADEADDASPWSAPAGLFHEAFEHGSVHAEHLRILVGLEGLARARGDAPAFRSQTEDLHQHIVGMAERHGLYDKVPLELTYYKSKVLDYSQYIFVLSFLLMAGMWLRPRAKLIYAATSASVLVATLLLCLAIVLRCVIRGRPPVSTLYETVLFVVATGALVAMFVEAVNRQRIAISSAAILGVVGLFIANGYEMLDKRDTMPSLVAVLDTNFWLATHVTAITIGYSAGMLAALLASVYLLAKLVGVKKKDGRTFYRNIGRMVYGVLCFAMIFSLVGTILGGIWANDSWGRFWGWDPKENGALLIVLSQLVILHGRMGGYLREHGICMVTAFGGTVIAFSWWGVNLLGVGLHSYGFTSGIHTALWTYYYIQWGIVGLGALVWYRERTHDRALAQARARREPEPEREKPFDGKVEGTPA